MEAEKQLEIIKQAVKDAIHEISWYVERRVDLNKPIEPGQKETYADMLRDDLAILKRSLLRKLEL